MLDQSFEFSEKNKEELLDQHNCSEEDDIFNKDYKQDFKKTF